MEKLAAFLLALSVLAPVPAIAADGVAVGDYPATCKLPAGFKTEGFTKVEHRAYKYLVMSAYTYTLKVEKVFAPDEVVYVGAEFPAAAASTSTDTLPDDWCAVSKYVGDLARDPERLHGDTRPSFLDEDKLFASDAAHAFWAKTMVAALTPASAARVDEDARDYLKTNGADLARLVSLKLSHDRPFVEARFCAPRQFSLPAYASAKEACYDYALAGRPEGKVDSGSRTTYAALAMPGAGDWSKDKSLRQVAARDIAPIQNYVRSTR